MLYPSKAHKHATHLECFQAVVAACLEWPLHTTPPEALVVEGRQAQEHHDAKHIRQPVWGEGGGEGQGNKRVRRVFSLLQGLTRHANMS